MIGKKRKAKAMTPNHELDDIPDFCIIPQAKRNKSWEIFRQNQPAPAPEEKPLPFTTPQTEKERAAASYESNHVAELNGIVDDDAELDYHEWMIERALRPFTCRHILAKFSALAEELEELQRIRARKAVANDQELQLLEAYKRLDKATVTCTIENYREIVNAAEAMLENRRRQRKPRKIKKVRVEKVVKKVKFAEIEPTTKTASLPPEMVVGKTVLWAYDVQKRVIKYFRAKEGEKFTFKATRLMNIDETLSTQKKVRKPEEFLPLVLNESKPAVLGMFKKLKAVEQSPTDYTNKNLVFLRVFG